MPRLSAVIGANYGDEGKGLITDYLSTSDTLVIRFNGGAQAGHTVVTPDGRRHVFHHFGSGTFAGARTYLAKPFVVNPVVFVQELGALLGKMAERPLQKIFVAEGCPVTTPYDMMLNQYVETFRSLSGTGRHGSCGLGVNETIVRHSRGYPLNLRATDLMSGPRKYLRSILNKIRKEYVPVRAKELGLHGPIPNIMNDKIMENFLDDIEVFRSWIELPPFHFLVDTNTHLLFEGAQGLGLSEDYTEGFPYVTRSKTGLANVVKMLRRWDVKGWASEEGEELSAYYVTRTYLTRHGPGPLENEVPSLPGVKVDDPTNVPNEWQGTIRYGKMTPDAVSSRIKRDVEDNTGVWHGKIQPHLAVTCVDQVDCNNVEIVGTDGVAGRVFISNLFERLGFRDKVIYSTGPTRSNVLQVPQWKFIKPYINSNYT
jgi:adenylosuccinate synthase